MEVRKAVFSRRTDTVHLVAVWPFLLVGTHNQIRHINEGVKTVMSSFKRIGFIVLDSVGIGEAPDAASFGDAGSHTLGTYFGAGTGA
jgi:hypothetical protein